MDKLTLQVYRNRFTPQQEHLGNVEFDGDEFDYRLPAQDVELAKGTLEQEYRDIIDKEEPKGVHVSVFVKRKPKTREHILAITNWRLGNGLFFGVPFLDILTFFEENK